MAVGQPVATLHLSAGDGLPIMSNGGLPHGRGQAIGDQREAIGSIKIMGNSEAFRKHDFGSLIGGHEQPDLPQRPQGVRRSARQHSIRVVGLFQQKNGGVETRIAIAQKLSGETGSPV